METFSEPRGLTDSRTILSACSIDTVKFLSFIRILPEN
jgi:hypothetical protein